MKAIIIVVDVLIIAICIYMMGHLLYSWGYNDAKSEGEYIPEPLLDGSTTTLDWSNRIAVNEDGDVVSYRDSNGVEHGYSIFSKNVPDNIQKLIDEHYKRRAKLNNVNEIYDEYGYRIVVDWNATTEEMDKERIKREHEIKDANQEKAE